MVEISKIHIAVRLVSTSSITPISAGNDLIIRWRHRPRRSVQSVFSQVRGRTERRANVMGGDERSCRAGVGPAFVIARAFVFTAYIAEPD